MGGWGQRLLLGERLSILFTHHSVSEMQPTTEVSNGHRSVTGRPTLVNVVLLASAGLALIGAGALIAWRSGSFISFGDTVLTAIAWCL
jgi:hypothetical protein